MFEYLENHKGFVIALGNFVSHKVVSYYDKDKGRVFRTPGELNKLDRLDLAYQFCEETHPSYFIGSIDGADMRDDIALFIDERIPKSYAKWYLKDSNRAPSKMNISAKDYGLIYHYKHK